MGAGAAAAAAARERRRDTEKRSSALLTANSELALDAKSNAKTAAAAHRRQCASLAALSQKLQLCDSAVKRTDLPHEHKILDTAARTHEVDEAAIDVNTAEGKEYLLRKLERLTAEIVQREENVS